MIKLVRYAWFILLAAAVGPAVIVSYAAYSFGAEVKELPKPADVKCFVLVRPCSLGSAEHLPKWIYINPLFVASVGNPPESPKGCVRINTTFGRQIYIYGDDVNVAKLIANGIETCQK